MLTSRRLDDQSYADIVAEAKGRLPWLCPVWTDHNAHDPGITLLELMAWYKELQQYQMDQLTPALQRGLLKLAGVEPLPAQPARCALEYPPDAPPRAFLSRLGNRQGVSFELIEPIPADRPSLERVAVYRGEQRVEVRELLAGGTAIRPFRFGGEPESGLLLGFSRLPRRRLRLWFGVRQPEGAPRNPPDRQTRPPRTLFWEAEGLGELRPAADETLALSWSGYVSLPVPKAWPKGEDGLYWLRLSQTEGGCEEEAVLYGVSAGRYRAAQQETRARSYPFRIPAEERAEVRLDSEQAVGAELAVFLRDAGGWRQTADYRDAEDGAGRTVQVDASGALQDGQPNLLAVCLDSVRVHDLLFDAKGRPGEQLFLNLGGAGVLDGRLALMCHTVQPDGSVRPAPWRCVDDLSVCSPRDRVFTYDPLRETVTFGDGEHGATVAPGQGAVMVTELTLSLCGGGNIPANSGLVFRTDAMPADNGAAAGGRDRESLREARARLLKTLGSTRKCLSAEDYAQRARETPGLRVAGAKALPGFDRRNPYRRASAFVTVVVLPAQEGPKPVADARFLEAVARQLDRRRTVCIRTEAVPARFVPFALSVRVLAAAGTDVQALRQALERHFAAREERIGAPAAREETEALLQAQSGVYRVSALALRGLDQGSYRTEAGDLVAPPDAILTLEQADIRMTYL